MDSRVSLVFLFAIFHQALSFQTVPNVRRSCVSRRCLVSATEAEAAPAPKRPVSIITGGSGGIGFAVARSLAAKGHDLVIAHGKNMEAASEVKDALVAEFGCGVATVSGDLTEEDSREDTVAAIFDIVDQSFSGTVGSFVHAAGFFHEDLMNHHLDGKVDEFTVYDQYQSIYPKTFVSILEKCLPRMLDGQGRAVAITNPGCNAITTPRVGYDMPGQGKAAMEFCIRLYAMRLAPRGICVNLVSPGYTDTREWNKVRARLGEGDLEKGGELLNERMISRSPIRRWAQPHEIANAVDFLCSPEAGLITGAFIPVDGGLHLV